MLGNLTGATYPRDLVVGCPMRGIRMNVVAQIVSEWKNLYRGNTKVFFLPGMVTTLCKQLGVPLMDSIETLPMYPLFHSHFVKPASSKGKRKGRWARSEVAEQ